LVRRDRRRDRPCPKCDGIVATLGASTEAHASSMICTCGRFIAWLSDRMNDGVLSDAALGVMQPISLADIEDHVMTTEPSSDDNRGALFANSRHVEGDNRPNFTGPGKIFGRDIQISGWSKVAKNGTKFMSLRFKETAGSNGVRFSTTSTSSSS
jgi:hypothetical protein